MARKFLTAIDMAKNELQNAVVQNLASAPSSPVKGQLYFDTTGNVLYWWNGTAWVAASPGTGFPGYGTITASTTFGQAKADGVATTVARSDHVHGTPLHDNAAHAAIELSALAPPTANLNINNMRLTGVGTPVGTTDAATKGYVDQFAQGLSWKDSCRLATTGNITLSGSQSVDGVAVAGGDRILVKSQTNAAENGIYSANTVSAWTRVADMDQAAEFPGAATFVEEGSTLADTAWIVSTNAPVTVGTTNITWTQFGAGASYTAGNGLTLTGNVIDLVPANGSLTVAADSVQVGYAGSGLQYGSAVTAARSDHDHRNVYVPVGYATDCAAATSTVVTHNLQTKDVIVCVYDNTTPFAEVMCDVEHTSTTQVTVRFAVAPTAAQYRIVVIPRA